VASCRSISSDPPEIGVRGGRRPAFSNRFATWQSEHNSCPSKWQCCRNPDDLTSAHPWVCFLDSRHIPEFRLLKEESRVPLGILPNGWNFHFE